MIQVQFDKVGKPSTKSGIKRARISTTCGNCRRRKIKCNKEKPCSNCVKAGHQDNCKYESIKWANTKLSESGEVILEAGPLVVANKRQTQTTLVQNDSIYVGLLEDEVARLKKQVDRKISNNRLTFPKGHPPVDENKMISLYDGYNQLLLLQGQCSNFGPFNWCTFVLKDGFSKMAWYSLCLTQEKLIRSAGEHSIPEFSSSLLPIGFRSVRDTQMMVKFELKDRQNFIKKISIGPKKAFKLKGLELNDDAELEIQIRDYLLSVLPKQKVFWICVCRFFRYFHPFVPYLDQSDFVDTTSEILEPTEFIDEPFGKIDIKDESDYSKFATILLVVALGSLTLGTLDTDDAVPCDDLFYMMRNPVGLDLSRAAHSCIHQFQDTLTIDLPTLQSLLYLSIYQTYSPESGDFCNSNSRVLNGVILQMALSLGLNNGPVDITEFSPLVQKELNLKRKIWRGVISLDFYQTFVSGYSSLIVIDNSEGILPDKPTIMSKNAFDFRLESISYEKWVEKVKQEKLITNNLSCTLDMNNKTKITKIIAAIESIEHHMCTTYGSLNSIISRRTDADGIDRISFYYAKLFDLKCYLSGYVLCVMLRQHLFLQFEADNEPKLAEYYFTKLFQDGVEFAKICKIMVGNMSELFEPYFQFAVIPDLEIAIHKIKMICWGGLLRLIFYKGNLLLTETLSDKLEAMISSCMRLLSSNSHSYLTPLNKLATRYYYAWKVGKVHFKIHSILFEPLERGEFPLETVTNLETGIKTIHLKWDEENITALPSRSFISDYNTDELANFCATIESIAYGKSSPPSDIKVNAIPSTELGAHNTTNVTDPLSDFHMLTSVEVENFWNDFMMENQGFNFDVPDGISSDSAFDMYFPEVRTPGLSDSERFTSGIVER